MTKRERELIEAAMGILESAPNGGIGCEGPTVEDLEELEEAGRVAEDDAGYHACQRAWRYLELALASAAGKGR